MSMMHRARRRRARFLIIAALIGLGCASACKEETRSRAEQRGEEVKTQVRTLAATARDKSNALLGGLRAERLEAMSDEEFASTLSASLEEIRRYDEGLNGVSERVAQRDDLFPDVLDSLSFKSLKPDQRRDLRDLYAAHLDYSRALDGIKRAYRGFARINPLKRPDRHAATFLISYLAWIVQYRHGALLIDRSVPNRGLETFFDEPDPRLEIPAGSFAALKHEIIGVETIPRFLALDHYYLTQRHALKRGACAQSEPCHSWAMSALERHRAEIRDRLERREATSKLDYAYNGFDIARDAALGAWFPLQAGVAEWLGDTKIKRPGEHLISDPQLKAMRARMEPGDIIVARKNWYLSNVGLPGFWPHAELYLGSPEELDAYFADADLPAHLENFQAERFSEHLASSWPQAWRAYERAPDHHGSTHRVIEAISEGVVFSTLERAAGADYVGVLRPRRSKAAKARAILRAFGYWGRPYDFNFDFMTDSTLVCTELVFKSWEREQGYDGLELKLVEMMGRDTLPANELVRQFARERGEPSRQLDFIYFLDGVEHEQRAEVADEEAFASSCDRPKWDTAQR